MTDKATIEKAARICYEIKRYLHHHYIKDALYPEWDKLNKNCYIHTAFINDVKFIDMNRCIDVDELPWHWMTCEADNSATKKFETTLKAKATKLLCYKVIKILLDI